MKPQRISLESEVLEEFRDKLNAALEIVTCQLVRRKLYEGVVSASVRIEVEERADDKTGEVYYSMNLEPKVKIKIGASDDMKCVKRGGIIMKQDYQGRPLIASEQISMDEIKQEGA